MNDDFERMSGTAVNYMGKQLKKWSYKLASNLAKKFGPQLITLLAPLWPILLGFALFFIFTGLMLSATYGAMPQEQYMTGINPSKNDAAILAQTKKIASEYSVKESILMCPGVSTPEKPGYGESHRSDPFYPAEKGTAELNSDQIDKYGHDYALRLTWGTLHAIELYYAYDFNTDIKSDDMANLADALKPYFYYKKSEVITTTTSEETISTVKGPETVENTSKNITYVYLLVESDTIYGHDQYHYKWTTETTASKDSTTTVEYEELNRTDTLSTWDRFDQIIENIFKTKGTKYDSIAMARTAILQAAAGFDGQQQVWDWLLENPSDNFFDGPIPMVTDKDIAYQPIKNPQAVIDYLKGFDSALASQKYLDELDQASMGKVNPLLILAIAGQEQSFVPQCYSDWTTVIENPFNVYHSWMEYHPGFDISAQVAVITVANLAQDKPPGENVIEWINGFGPNGTRDNPRWGYAGDPNWWKGVSKFYTQLISIGD